MVGSAELPLLRKQTADFAGHRARYGLPVTYEEIPGADHFTIMHEMMSPKGRITTLIRQLFERTALTSVILRSERHAASRRMQARLWPSWFETREDALLTMRSKCGRCANDQRA